jgi:membrane associated rhomboid family serine protease
MNGSAEQWVSIAVGLDEARANDFSLVLIARGIQFQRQPGSSGWEIWVPFASAEAAAAELTLYRRENAHAIGPRKIEEIGDGWPGVLAYVAILVSVFFALHTDALNRDWLAAGRLDAGAVRSGEWWRVVTALTLHIDLDHIGGNLAFGAFFGYFVGRYLGRGVGWLAVLGTAALANCASAFLEAPDHRAIGASTAVFAALGLLVAYTWRRGYLRETPWRGRIAPIVAGLGLLAFTGTGGENTDLGAHLLGFVMGFGGGLVLAATAGLAWLENRRVQGWCAATALAVVAAAWVVGLVSSG